MSENLCPEPKRNREVIVYVACRPCQTLRFLYSLCAGIYKGLNFKRQGGRAAQDSSIPRLVCAAKQLNSCCLSVHFVFSNNNAMQSNGSTFSTVVFTVYRPVGSLVCKSCAVSDVEFEWFKHSSLPKPVRAPKQCTGMRWLGQTPSLHRITLATNVIRIPVIPHMIHCIMLST